VSEPDLILDMNALVGGYGGNDILKGASLTVRRNEIVVIVGPNGAGKSTLMKSAFGLVKIRQGSVTFEGEDITNMRPDLVVRRGMSYVPQEKNVFPSMTVQENLEMGGYLRKRGIAEKMDHIFQIFPRLKERRKQAAGSMSGGERQMVAMGRALMLDPTLILMDEPTAGLSPLFIEQTFDRIIEVNKLGISVLMVEQNAKQALEIAHRGYVLAMGRNRHEDTGAGLLGNQEIAEMFLGG
jgi:branched-chain amino acid transport system ATP-binding protein